MGHSLRHAVNCSLLFTELPLLERPAAAHAEGFDAVEFWWPWPENPTPPDADVERFVRAVRDSGVALIGLNFFGGDLLGPDAGVLSIPGRAQQFRDNIEVTVGIGAELGVPAFNALYGNRVDDVSVAEQDDTGTESLVLAAEAAARVGATVLVEPISGPKPYPLRTAGDVIEVVERVRAAGAANVAMLFDLFHLANNGDDLDAAIAEYATYAGHVQVADFPGRHEPGTGELDLDRYLDALQQAGYDGYVALEYNPAGSTVDGLGWLPRDVRSRR